MPEEFEFEPPRKQGKFRNFASAHRQAWRDVKKRGRRGLVWVIFLIVFFGLIKSLQVLLSDPTIIIDNINTACRPDDSFTIGSDAYNWWRARGFFDITMGYGKMTFAQAKAVDVAWDVFVGRGGQALLAVISWRVFAKYVTTSIAVTPVTFSTFRTVFLHNEATIGSISQFIGDFSRRHGLRSKAAMVFMIVTMMFILAFPTFGGAMTGYKGNVESFVQDRSGNLLPFTSFKYVHYIIHDGDRIGKGQRYMVSAPNPPTGELLLRSSDWLAYCKGPQVLFASTACELINEVTQYVVDNGLNGSKASPSKFMEIDLPSPVLNIEPIYLPYSYLNNFNWDNSTLGTPSVMSWEASSVLYNSTYVEEQGSCQPLKNYQWGFSYIQVNVMIILVLLWMMGILCMYSSSYLTMRRWGKNEVSGEHKAVLELASAMQKQLQQELERGDATDVQTMSEHQIRRRIAKDLNGGSILLKSTTLLGSEHKVESNISEHEIYPFSFKDWMKGEKWWLIFLFLSMTAMWVCVFFAPTWVIFLLLPFAVLFAMYVSESSKNRGVIVFWLVLVLGVVPTMIIRLYLLPGYQRYV